MSLIRGKGSQLEDIFSPSSFLSCPNLNLKHEVQGGGLR